LKPDVFIRRLYDSTATIPPSGLKYEKSRKPTIMTMFQTLIDEIQGSQISGTTKKQLRALTRITDLFAAESARYSKQQIELFGEVFKALVAVIESKTRIKLAQHLATDPAAPATLVRVFAFDDDVAVAAPVLSQSTVLSDSDLVDSARSHSQDHLYAIAQRRTLSEVLTDILIERGECNVVRAVARNPGARISDRGFQDLVLRSSHDARLALHVGSRRDIPRQYFLMLLETASAAVCERIIATNPQFTETVQGTVTEVVDEINRKMRNKSSAHAKARKKVRRLKYWKELGEAKVHAAARAQDFEQAVLALSILARCPIEVAERAVLNENPGAVQVVAKAARCSWATVKALLSMRIVNRSLSRTDFDQVRENYERLKVRTARRVLDFYASRRNVREAASPPLAPAAPTSSEAFARHDAPLVRQAS
jgi:uncharacterized protein (DUF2336 family)